MRPLKGAVSLCALIVVAAVASPAEAAWNNVFQVCCHRCQQTPSTSGYFSYYEPCAPACPDPCPPQQCCKTEMVQRSFYQPVTTYERRTFYEPVTTQRVSYFWEPVTSCRTSWCFDPCTCQWRSVSTPVTSFRLRQRCDPVTSYLQRCQMVPVTKQQLVTYYEPVTTCTSVGGAQTAPVQTQAPPLAQPGGGVQEGTFPTQPQGGAVQESQKPVMPGAGSGYRQPVVPQAPQSPAPPSRNPSVKLDKIVMLPRSNFEGRIVSDDRRPQPLAQVLLVSATESGVQKTVTADDRGDFSASIPEGKWLVYVRDGRGVPVFQAQMEMKARETRQVTLTSR